jgi:hypothetical protein
MDKVDHAPQEAFVERLARTSQQRIEALEAENAALKARGPVLSEAEVDVLEYIKDVLASVDNAAGVEVIENLLERSKR